ncbi:WG containing repeat-containing protein [Paenibacillus sp. 1_12]|nr:WG containing repeat-containing protein [Paenibacillus sp. 1_12]
MVKKEDKWGFIDNTGKEIVAVKFERAFDFSEGLAAVKVKGKWGFINKP